MVNVRPLYTHKWYNLIFDSNLTLRKLRVRNPKLSSEKQSGQSDNAVVGKMRLKSRRDGMVIEPKNKSVQNPLRDDIGSEYKST